eukprot:4334769-Amphidinium_carterae.1
MHDVGTDDRDFSSVLSQQRQMRNSHHKPQSEPCLSALHCCKSKHAEVNRATMLCSPAAHAKGAHIEGLHCELLEYLSHFLAVFAKYFGFYAVCAGSCLRVDDRSCLANNSMYSLQRKILKAFREDNIGNNSVRNL